MSGGTTRMLLLDRSSAPMVRPGGGGGKQLTGVGDCSCRRGFVLVTDALATLAYTVYFSIYY